MNEVTGLGQRAVGLNPTAHGRLLAADLDHVGMQVTPENVLQIRNAFLGTAQRLNDAFRREGRNLAVGPPGGDPISQRWADSTNGKLQALHPELQAHIDALTRFADELKRIAVNYGHTEQAIADSFKQFMNDNQGSWEQRRQQIEEGAGLPAHLRDLLGQPPRPGPH